MRITRQRTAISDLLQATEQFLSAQEIHDRLTNRGESVGLATVYRNLQLLADAGEVDVLRQDGTDTQLFRYCASTRHHHHLLCRNCGTTVELADDRIEKLIREVAGENGFTNISHDVEIYGLCANCSKEA